MDRLFELWYAFWDRVQDRFQVLDQRAYHVVSFKGGRLRVIRGECGAPNLTLVWDWADMAYDKWLADRGFPPDTDIRVRGRKLKKHGYYTKRMIIYHCGEENVIRHELFHHWSYVRGDYFWKKIDHKPGYTLKGEPQ
jgi:hypothetical protein